MSEDPNIKYVEDRIAELDEKINSAPGWGAAVGAWAEERDALARIIDVPPIRKPCAD